MALSFDPADVRAKTLCDIHLMETGETLHPSYTIVAYQRLAEACEEVVSLRNKLGETANARTRGADAPMKFHPAWWQEGMLDG